MPVAALAPSNNSPLLKAFEAKTGTAASAEQIHPDVMLE